MIWVHIDKLPLIATSFNKYDETPRTVTIEGALNVVPLTGEEYRKIRIVNNESFLKAP
jgi:hypothetical protein